MDQSLRFRGEVVARFGALSCVISPILQPRFLPIMPIDPATTAVIFTSQTGVAAAVAAGLTPAGGFIKIAYCVGARTALAAREAGFVANDAQGDWRDLVKLITRLHGAGPLCFLSATEAAPDLQVALKKAGHHVQRLNVYTQDTRALNAQAIGLLQGTAPVLLPLFSARSAQVFCTLAPSTCAPIWIAALSAKVAQAFTLPFVHAVMAARPNSAALLDAMGQLLDIGSTRPAYP